MKNAAHDDGEIKKLPQKLELALSPSQRVGSILHATQIFAVVQLPETRVPKSLLHLQAWKSIEHFEITPGLFELEIPL